jgi:hypothetical protein
LIGTAFVPAAGPATAGAHPSPHKTRCPPPSVERQAPQARQLSKRGRQARALENVPLSLPSRQTLSYDRLKSVLEISSVREVGAAAQAAAPHAAAADPHSRPLRRGRLRPREPATARAPP